MTEHERTPEQDIAVCIRNLKGSRHKELIETARALQRLRNLPEHRSNTSVGRVVGASGEIVREFLTLLLFPEDLQKRFEENRLGLEHGRRLWQYTRAIRRCDCIDWDRIRPVADVMETMTALDSRDLVLYLRDHPDTHPEQARTRVLESHTSVRPQYHVVVVLAEEDYDALLRAARRLGASLDGLATEVVTRWLRGSHLENEDA